MLTFNFTPFPELTTERLTLRSHVESDSRDLWEIREHDAVRKVLDRPSQSLAEVQNLIEIIIDGVTRNSAVSWAITFRGQKKLIGNVGFWKIQAEHHRAEIGYMLSPERWNSGVMTEALMAVLNYGFDSMNLHSVEAHVDPSNVASIRVLEKCGFVREALLRENFVKHGRFFDSAIYSLLEPAFRTAISDQ